MNKIFKVVYNRTTQTWMVVSELARGKSKSQRGSKHLKNSLVATAVAVALSSAAQASTPTDQEYVDQEIGKVTARVDRVGSQVNDINKIVVQMMPVVNTITTTLVPKSIEYENRITTLESDKVDRTELTNLAIKDEVAADLAGKASQTDLNAANSKIATLESDKANTSDVSALETRVGTIEQAGYLTKNTADPLYATKATETVANDAKSLAEENKAALSTKANQTDLNVANGKIAALENGKADQTALDATNANLAKKADQTALDATNANLAKKADQTALDATNTNVTNLQASQAAQDGKIAALESGKADKDEVTKALYEAGKVADSRIDGKVADVKTELTAEINKKADQTALDATNANVTNLQASQAAQDGKIAALESGKADKDEVTKALYEAGKVADSRIDGKVADVKTELTTEINKKADQTALDTTNANVTNLQASQAAQDGKIAALESGKADTDAVNRAITTLTSAINDKADTDDVSALETRVGTIEQAGYLTKNTADPLYATKATETVANDAKSLAEENKAALSTKANQTDLNVANGKIAALENGKADQTALDATNTNVTNLQASQAAQDGKIAALESGKADKTELASLATKDEVAALVNLPDLSGVATKDELTAGLATKANATDVVALQSVVDTKADKATVNADFARMGGQLAQLDSRMATVEHEVERLDREFERGMATQSALSGLFQPYNIGKANLTMALGGYNSQTAVAIGTGYRFNENIAGKAALATSTSKGGTSYNVGVNFEW